MRQKLILEGYEIKQFKDLKKNFEKEVETYKERIDLENRMTYYSLFFFGAIVGAIGMFFLIAFWG